MKKHVQPINRLSRLSWLKAMLMTAVLLLAFGADEASACKLEDTYRYNVTLEGTHQLRLKMPLYDKDDYDCWIVSGAVYIQPEGGSKETLFYYESQRDIDRGDYLPRIYSYRGVDGTMILYRDRGYSNVSIGTSKGNELCPCVDNQDYAIVNLLWDIPYKYRGKKVTISWSIHHNGNMTEYNKWIGIDPTTIFIPTAPQLQHPMLMDPIISYETGHPNQILVPYMIATNKLQKMTAHYTEVYPSGSVNRTVTLPTTTSDFMRLPADVCIKEFYIESTYTDTEDKTQTTQSTKCDLPILHHPQGLSASMQPNGKVLLRWKVNNYTWKDISNTDTWEIQRNVTGDPTNAEWTSMGQLNYDDKESEFTFEDENLLAFYQQAPVYYRVRRVITAVWGWTPESGYATTMLPATLALPSITEATVSRNGTWNDNEHSVLLKFKGRMLTDNFATATPEYDKNNYLVLRDSNDWKLFVRLVKDANGSKDIHAIMAADITTSYSVGSLSDFPYQGIFNGNGHTLTVNIDGGSVSGMAPFNRVKNATIKNLRVVGTVSGGIHSAGLIGFVSSGTATVENCHISTQVTAQGNSTNAPHAGGIIGHGGTTTITIRNCLFDGTVIADNTTGKDMSDSYVGSFLGWSDNGRPQTITNNLERGTYIGFSHNGANYINLGVPTNIGGTNNYNSNNWGETNKTTGLAPDQLASALGSQWKVEGGTVLPKMSTDDESAHKTLIWDDRAKVVLNVNKYVDVTNDNTFSISSEDDWKAFAAAVKASKGDYAVNCKLTTDITVSEPLEKYSGFIEGNGHTITLNLTKSNLYYSLIRYGYSIITIRNLNVKGVVSGSNYCAGLIGMLSNDMANLTVENCHVSANISTSNDGYAAGFVANANSGKVTLRNCLFDGNVSFTGLNSYSMVASFVNRSHRAQDMTVENCLENGTYNGYNNVVAVGYYDGNSHKAWDGGINVWTYATIGFKEINHIGDGTPEQLAAKLGSQWQVKDGKVVPIKDNGPLYTERRELTDNERLEGQLTMDLKTSCVDHVFYLSVEPGESTMPLSVDDEFAVTKTETGDLAVYKFDNNVVIGEVKADTLQNAVSLSWECTRGLADYFRIKRYDKQTPDKIEVLEAEYSEMAYMDRTVRPQHTYTYIIEGVTQCEGENVSKATVDGCCVPTGMVRGYVRLTNGTGLAGYTVVAEPVGNIPGAEVKSCETDETGYFEIGGLVYSKYGEYSLSVTDPNREASFDSQIVTFDEDVNLQTNMIFTQTNYYIFSGYVLYEGSSIPVSGVRFLRDGVEVVNSNGKPVTTNNQGAFEVSIPQGSHQIQIVKDGHVFQNNGYYITEGALPDSTWHNWQKSISEVYLWDQTKVNLQGRVVGGNDQGLLALGKSLSKNNLGDDITIVMQLEGDNTSWIVRDQLNSSVTERHDEFLHGVNDTTKVDAYRHRIVIHPDLKTGEYSVPMYPVKYKVTEVYAKGYSTLFQTGMVSETIDLNNYHNGDTAVYSRIYHSQPTLDIWQFNGTQDRYYGIKQYTSQDNAGIRDTVVLWRKTDSGGKYTLDYPVFMAGASVPMVLSAREEYRYNNDAFGDLDIVQLDGGRVIAGNQLVGYDQTDEIDLDDEGQGTYVFTPQNLTLMLEDDMALRTLKFTLEYDGSFYDIKPIEAYVMAALAKPQGRRIIAGQNTHLIDILRDPPGAGSSAYIEKGSKMSYSYNADYNVQMGVNMKVGVGSGANYYTGIWAGVGSGTIAGTTASSDNLGSLSYDLATSYYQDWSYEYEFETKEKISTSSNVKEVGMNSDVYIGMTDNVIVEDAVAVRAVNSAAMQRLFPGMGGKTTVNGHVFDVTGTAKVLARGWDAEKKDSVYLVRDEVMQLSSKINTTFAHSQSYLLTELIPTLLRTRNALLMDSTTTSTYAQTLANKQKRPVYVSKVSTTNPYFSMENYYDTYKPTGVKDEWTDSIKALNSQIATWVGFIAANEKEKLEAYDLVKVYDFDGRSEVEYSESFTTSEGLHRYWKIPSAVNLTGEDTFSRSTSNNSKYSMTNDDDYNIVAVDFKAGGVKFSINITPLFGFDFNYQNGKSEEYSKETGFTLSCDRKSSLTVAVYKTREISSDSIAKLSNFFKSDSLNVFYKHVEDNLKSIYNGRPGSSNTTSYITSISDVPKYRNLVFRTLAGATGSPWEEERRTMFYNPGTILDHGTEQINKLRIWTEVPSVSNVPYGEPARFTLYMVNESDLPDRVSHSFKFYSDDAANPKGAKIYIDGVPLNGGGADIWLDANEVVEKQVEVYAGPEYDYENLAICLFDEDDLSHIYTTNISAHFVPSAGKINISKPGDKWVVNTESAYDEDKEAYYLPVHIDGFDVNFRNFDHIELQYKLSNQGDKDWVNVCSYYPNTEEGARLMALASGEKKLMEHDGYIDAFFYGETDPIEQYYDIRAVTFCRHGNGYLTNSSNILTGIKDTRRPQVFGTPQPVDGILGIGDDIILRFSEPIAGNYLSEVNNFQIIGQTNSSNLSLSSSLHFNGSGAALAQADRSLEGRSFTVDVMLNPEHNGQPMTFFSHGFDNYAMELGLTADHRLTVAIQHNDTIPATVFTADKPCKFDGLREVFFLFDTDVDEFTTKISFYDGNTEVGSFTYPNVYLGSGSIILGRSVNELLKGFKHYTGDMLEFRLWNHALSKAEMNSYRQKRLNGYELGLLDNYPLSEGKGNYSYNRTAGGSDLMIIGPTWKMPDGIGMKLDGDKGFRLDSRPFNRYDHEDYTMAFWFRTEDANGTLFSNGPATTEPGAKSHFNFAVKDGIMNLSLSGLELSTSSYISDGNWHHAALTVNRSNNVGSLYVDTKLTNTFAVDTLGGVSGNLLAAGATYVDANTVKDAIHGHIDEIAMYEMALTENAIKAFASNTPTGEEMGLMAYLNFSENVRQASNEIKLMPTGVSLRRYKDTTTGEFTSQCDTIVAEADVNRCFDRGIYAPMHDPQSMENIKFSYVADGKELLINLDVPAASIEKTNVLIVVNDVADMQGNIMASPTVMDLYVYRNPLRWSDKHKRLTAKYGEEQTFEATVKNLSGKTRNFTLQGLPLWMTASMTSGSVAALDEEVITFTISPYTNIGDFEEVVYLVGDDGMTEPLPITLKVRGTVPDWAVDEALLHTNITMNIIGQVIIEEEVARDEDDMLAVFDKNHRLLGVGHCATDKNNGANDGLIYLNVYNSNYAEIDLYFEFYEASTGIIHKMMPMADLIQFKHDTVLGTTTDPVQFGANNGVVQAIPLKKGWNWVSVNVEPSISTVGKLLNNATKWEVGDALEAERPNGSYSLLSYKASPNPYDPNNPIYSWDCSDSTFTVDATKMYRFYSNSDKIGYIYGFTSYKAITVKKGWNRIGYISQFNLPLGTAMAEYTEKASAGDIIKSQSEFAVLSVDAHGNKQWKGTLEFLRVGEGYMLKRNADSEVGFLYPYYFSNSRYNGSNARRRMPAFQNVSGSSMTVVAVAEGVDVMPGDRLTVYNGAEVCGIAEADAQGVFYLNVGEVAHSTLNTSLSFTLEREGETIAATSSPQMSYVNNAAIGTPDNPTAISFLAADNLYGDGWYTVSGIKLNGKPSLRGVYIHNGQKITIK